MLLTVREAAHLLEVSEQTVSRWITRRHLPAFRINGHHRLNRDQVLDWATAQRLAVSPDLVTGDAESARPSLVDALRSGGVFHQVTGDRADTVLRAVIDRMPLPEDIDRAFLFQVLMAREKLASTAIGDGIAIPHVRNPVVIPLAAPLVCLSFLAQPIDYGALDGRPVHTLFTILSPTVKSHLGLLSTIGFGLRDPGFAAVIRRQAPTEDILAVVERLSDSLAARNPSTP